MTYEKKWKLIQLWLSCLLLVGALGLFFKLGAETQGMTWSERCHYVVTVPFRTPDGRPLSEHLKAVFTPPANTSP